MKHILSVNDFSRERFEDYFARTDDLIEKVNQGIPVRQQIGSHAGKVLLTLFYEPSTRTRLSFEFAAHALGMQPIGSEAAGQFSSAAKGETLEDTLGVLGGYFAYVGGGVMAIRHDKTGEIAANAHHSQVPILNGGDGKGEHPTQTLTDLYTIHRFKNRLDNLKVVIGGDLARGRTVNSLAKALAMFNGNDITFVSPSELRLQDSTRDFLESRGMTFSETDDLAAAVKNADVFYMTRAQLERAVKNDNVTQGAAKLLVGNLVVTDKIMANLPEEAILLHPMPITNEYDPGIRNYPQAKHLQQAHAAVGLRIIGIDQSLSDQNSLQVNFY